MKRLISISLMFLLCSLSGCFLDTGDEEYTVSGTITLENGDPLYGVSVLLGSMTAFTNTEGKYKFKDVNFDSYYIQADPYNYTLYTYEPKGHSIDVTDDVTVNFIAYR